MAGDQLQLIITDQWSIKIYHYWPVINFNITMNNLSVFYNYSFVNDTTKSAEHFTGWCLHTYYDCIYIRCWFGWAIIIINGSNLTLRQTSQNPSPSTVVCRASQSYKGYKNEPLSFLLKCLNFISREHVYIFFKYTRIVKYSQLWTCGSLYELLKNQVDQWKYMRNSYRPKLLARRPAGWCNPEIIIICFVLQLGHIKQLQLSVRENGGMYIYLY